MYRGSQRSLLFMSSSISSRKYKYASGSDVQRPSFLLLQLPRKIHFGLDQSDHGHRFIGQSITARFLNCNWLSITADEASEPSPPLKRCQRRMYTNYLLNVLLLQQKFTNMCAEWRHIWHVTSPTSFVIYYLIDLIDESDIPEWSLQNYKKKPHILSHVWLRNGFQYNRRKKKRIDEQTIDEQTIYKRKKKRIFLS